MAQRRSWIAGCAVTALIAVASPVAADEHEFTLARPIARLADPAPVTYTVAVEDGLPVDAAQVAMAVAAILGHPRGWLAEGVPGFALVDADADMTILVGSPMTVDALCRPLRTGGYLSCHNQGVIAINADRWLRGAEAFAGNLEEYRRYLVNHEVGHFLGRSHEPCPARGATAPIMMQQTKSLGGCLPNGFVVPERVIKGPNRITAY